jgi:hypothetical protein
MHFTGRRVVVKDSGWAFVHIVDASNMASVLI